MIYKLAKFRRIDVDEIVVIPIKSHVEVPLLLPSQKSNTRYSRIPAHC